MAAVLTAPQNPRFHTSTFCSQVCDKLEEATVITREMAMGRGLTRCSSVWCVSYLEYDWRENEA